MSAKQQLAAATPSSSCAVMQGAMTTTTKRRPLEKQAMVAVLSVATEETKLVTQMRTKNV